MALVMFFSAPFCVLMGMELLSKMGTAGTLNVLAHSEMLFSAPFCVLRDTEPLSNNDVALGCVLC